LRGERRKLVVVHRTRENEVRPEAAVMSKNLEEAEFK
jgi:hypothetical protein